MSSFIPTRAVVPGVGHINAVVAVPEFVVKSIVFANVICSSKAEKSFTLQICWIYQQPSYEVPASQEIWEAPHSYKSRWSLLVGVKCTIQSFINQAQLSKKTRSCIFFTSVWVMWAQMSSPEASSEPEGILTWPQVTFIFSKLFQTILLIIF